MLTVTQCNEIRQLVYSEYHYDNNALQNSLMQAAFALGQAARADMTKPKWSMFRHVHTGALAVVAIGDADRFARENPDQRFHCDLVELPFPPLRVPE